MMLTGLKIWKSMALEVPERLRETLAPSIAPDMALAMAHPPSEEEFVGHA